MSEAVDAKFSIEAGNGSLPQVEELDSIRTHVTETQFSNIELLQSDELRSFQYDKPMRPLLDKSEHTQPIYQNQEPRHTRPDIHSQSLAESSTQHPRYVGRVDISVEEQPVFSFAQAPKTTADYGRKLRPNHVHTSVSGSIDILGEALGTLSNHSVINRHTDLPQPELPKDFSETVVPQQINSITNELPKNDIDTKLADRQTSYSIGDGSIARQNNSMIGSVPEKTIEDFGCSEVQRIEDRTYSILPLPQASSQMLPSKSIKIANRDHGVRGQGLRGLQTEQPTLPTAPSPVALRAYSVMPNALSGISDERPRVTKIRRKLRNSRPLHGLDSSAQRPVSETMPTEEDLLQILLYRNQQEKKARDTARAVQQARDAELQNIKQAYALLRSQMEEVSNRQKAQQTELAKYEKILPGWKIKVRKLEDYLKGLTNDHHKLRDDAQSIQRQQLLLWTDKTNILTRIEEARSAFGCHVPGAANIISEARHHIDFLKGQNDAQALRAQKDAELLEAEQERSQRLEQEISKISLNQQQMMELLHTQRLELMDKLSETLTTSATVLVSEPSNDQACTRDMLDQCIKMLQEIKTIEHVEPDDVERLDSSIQAIIGLLIVGSLNGAFQQLVETSQSACSKQLKLDRHIQKQLDNLKTSIKGEQTLSEQILDLREMKAAMRERLQASETSLAEARQAIIGLQGKEQYLETNVSALKAEILSLRAQPTEDPTTIDHVRQIESRNSDLEVTLSRKHEELSGSEDRLQRITADATEKQKLIDGLTSQVDEAKVTIRVLEKQKAGCEKQANIKYEGLKSQLLEASNAERAILADENLAKVEKLERLRSTAEKKATKAEEEMGRLRAGKEIQSKKLEEFQEKLGSLTLQIQSRDKEVREVEEKFRTTEENLLAQIQTHIEEKHGLDRRIAETETLLAASKAETHSKNEENLRHINEVCRAYDHQADAQVNIGHGIDILNRMLTQAKGCPLTPVLGESTSQEVTQQPVSPIGLRKQNVSVYEEGPHDLVHNGSALTLQRRRGGPSDTYASHQSRDEVVVQKSQIQKTTIRRNLTTIESRGPLEGINRALLRTPTNKFENRLEPPRLASMEPTYNSPTLSSPDWNSAELFPPTPIQSLKGRIDCNHTTLKSESRAMSGMDKGTGGFEAQSTGASHGAKIQQPSKPPRRVKRSAADFGMTPREIPSKRRIGELDTVGLDPIIADSQSPSKIQANNKSRKSRHQAPQDKYALRFHGVR
ncbi:hypothetical protein MMC27_005372 [Xylographa pallens]|nr:hypothetical protein [Xylographa pallens]